VSSTGISTTDARILLEQLLAAGGLPVMLNSGQLQAAPGVTVIPSDPWLVPIPSMARLERMSRWDLTIVAGAVDMEGIHDQLGTMIALTVQAMEAGRVPTDRTSVPKPRRLSGEGTMYLVVPIVALVPIDLATMPTVTAPSITAPEE
jgi:hypothetical protein